MDTLQKLMVFLFVSIVFSGCIFPPNPPPINHPFTGAGGDPGACGANLTIANSAYTMTSDRTTTRSDFCYSIKANNVSIDCAGHSITYTGAAVADGNPPEGIYSDGHNTVTVKNCVINNFPQAIRYDGGNNHTVSNNSIFNTSWIAVFIHTSNTNSSIFNNSVRQSGVCYYIGLSSTNITAYNNSAYNCSGACYGFSEFNTAGNIYANNTGTYCTPGLQDYQGNRNSFINNTIYNTTQGLWFQSTQNDVITNNTINNASTGIFFATTNSGNNTFLANNITASIWVNDSNNTNHYNNSNSGNIYYFINGTGSWEVFNLATTSPPGWATSGTSRPFNATTVGGNFTGTGLPQDWFPWVGVISTTLSTNVYIWNGTTWIDYNSSTLTFRCPNPPSICQPRNQNNATSQPIFRVQNNGTSTSTVQSIKGNTTWGTADFLCSATVSPNDGVNVTPANTFVACSSSTLTTGQNVSWYIFLNISSVPANFPRTFNLTMKVA
jgi:hypothetical protein